MHRGHANHRDGNQPSCLVARPLLGPRAKPGRKRPLQSFQRIEMRDFRAVFPYPIRRVEFPDYIARLRDLQRPPSIRLHDQQVSVAQRLNSARPLRIKRIRLASIKLPGQRTGSRVHGHRAGARRAHKIIEDHDVTVLSQPSLVLHPEWTLLRPTGHPLFEINNGNGVEHPHGYQRISGLEKRSQPPCIVFAQEL